MIAEAIANGLRLEIINYERTNRKCHTNKAFSQPFTRNMFLIGIVHTYWTYVVSISHCNLPCLLQLIIVC